MLFPFWVAPPALGPGSRNLGFSKKRCQEATEKTNLRRDESQGSAKVGKKKKERKREDAGNRIDRGEVVPGTHELLSRCTLYPIFQSFYQF